MEFTIESKIISALKLFAGQKDVRPTLNGLNLEIHSDKVILVATSGHMLGCYRYEYTQDITEPIKNVIIPNDLLKHVKTEGNVTLIISDEVNNLYERSVTVIYNGLSITGKSIDMMYPDYRRVIPNSTSNEISHFNADYLATIGKAYKILNDTKYALARIEHNGDNGALFNLGNDNFIGVIMPVRTDKMGDKLTRPSWLD